MKFQHDVELAHATAEVRVSRGLDGKDRNEFWFKTPTSMANRILIGGIDEARDLVTALTEALEKYRQFREVIQGEPNDLARIMKKRV